jgi:hemoglobin
VSELQEHEIFEVVGEDGFARISALFYGQVREDDLLSPMYPSHDLEGAERRLRQFLVYRFGGSDDYIQQRGHPRLRARHAPFVINRAARNRWMQLMTNAIEQAKIDEAAAEKLLQFFEAMATFLVNQRD